MTASDFEVGLEALLVDPLGNVAVVRELLDLISVNGKESVTSFVTA